MKLTIEHGDAALLLQAETPQDLDFLERMQGVHTRGPWATAEFLKTPVQALGFDHEGQGTCYMFGAGVPDAGGIYDVMAGVRLRLDWLTYRSPPTEAARLKAEAAKRVGYAILDLAQVIRADADIGSDAGGVG